MTAVAQRTEDLLFHGALAAQRGVTSGVESLHSTLQRKYAESKVVWFAIVIAVLIFLGLVLAVYLTVQCWNRGYAGFSGQVNWHFTSWTHFYVQVNFACVR
jgi:dolichyl-phosphate-mannose--protein O-mannosyl transferase